jgi:HB1, ASXL, restriction endonuclease HTH domain
MSTKKTAKPASQKTKKAAKAEPAPAPKPEEAAPAQLSALDAAAKVLAEAEQPLNCQEMIAAMAAKGYWSSPRGRTPASTLYSALLREINRKGAQARFRKTERGRFARAESR